MLKKFLLALALTLCASPAFASFSFYRTVTFSGASGTESNYTVLVCANSTLGNSNNCATVTGLNQSGAGAKVQNASGFDIVFGTTNTCTVKLNWEVEKYVASTGELIAWVKVSSLSSATTIYMCYDDASIMSFQGGSAGTAWDSSFKAVQHMGDGSTANLNDSTANANNGTNSAMNAAAGQIYGAISNPNGAHAWITGSTGIVTGTALSWAAWIGTTNANAGTFGKWTASVYDWMFYRSGGTNTYRIFLEAVGGLASCDSSVTSSATPSRLVGTYDGATLKLYINGNTTPTCTSSTSGNVQDSASSRVGWADYLQGGNTDDSTYDETYIAAVTWDTNWIADDYASQNAPATFETFGNETASGGGGGTSRGLLTLGVN